MPRTREFEETEALEKALQMFLAKGYESTSIPDLMEATGVNRQSLYNTFGDKKSFYLKALEAFSNHMKAKVGAVLMQKKPARSVLEDYRNTIKTMATSPMESKGCLLVNTVASSSYVDPDFKRRIKKVFQLRDRALAGVIARGQKSGELPKKHRPMAVAQTLHACLMGLSVMRRSNAPREEMLSVVDAMFDGLV